MNMEDSHLFFRATAVSPPVEVAPAATSAHCLRDQVSAERRTLPWVSLPALAGMPYGSEPHSHTNGRINTRRGGRGFYFEDPCGR